MSLLSLSHLDVLYRQRQVKRNIIKIYDGYHTVIADKKNLNVYDIISSKNEKCYLKTQKYFI